MAIHFFQTSIQNYNIRSDIWISSNAIKLHLANLVWLFWNNNNQFLGIPMMLANIQVTFKEIILDYQNTQTWICKNIGWNFNISNLIFDIRYTEINIEY